MELIWNENRNPNWRRLHGHIHSPHIWKKSLNTIYKKIQKTPYSLTERLGRRLRYARKNPGLRNTQANTSSALWVSFQVQQYRRPCWLNGPYRGTGTRTGYEFQVLGRPPPPYPESRIPSWWRFLLDPILTWSIGPAKHKNSIESTLTHASKTMNASTYSSWIITSQPSLCVTENCTKELQRERTRERERRWVARAAECVEDGTCDSVHGKWQTRLTYASKKTAGLCDKCCQITRPMIHNLLFNGIKHDTHHYSEYSCIIRVEIQSNAKDW